MFEKKPGITDAGSNESEHREDTENEKFSEFVEVDPTGRYGRYPEVLGKGAFKTVYRAFDEVDGIEVAWNQVKVQDVLQSPEDLERLYSEVHLLKTLNHKNIIKFFNSWVDTKTKKVNFITEIFTSGTLRQYRKRHRHVDIKAVKNWARQILRGLLYLHSHDPPIIHRDLKCDNIFVNGNQGEVKIGDLGLAAILRQAHAAHSVIGTPEFMAPELYEEEYNELVDIYSFGMCLLEMVTFEYPYSECTNAAQIYKKVTSGKKPASLDRVKDVEVRGFVEKCLATASRRLPARELLMDPFLQCEGYRETLDCAPQVSHTEIRTDDMEELGTPWEEFGLEAEFKEPGSSSGTFGGSSRGSFREGPDFADTGAATSSYRSVVTNDPGGSDTHSGHFKGDQSIHSSNNKEHRMRRSRDFRVKGRRRDDDTIFLRLRIANTEGHIRNIHFPFDVEGDTAMSVASEMVAELDLSDQDVTTIAEMIDAEILALVPEWKPGVACEENGGENTESSVNNDYTVSSECDALGTVSSDDSFLDQVPSYRKYLSFSPHGENVSPTAGNIPHGEATVYGRFEEITYPSRGSEHCEQKDPLFSSDSSEVGEDGEDWETGGDHSPLVSRSEVPGAGAGNGLDHNHPLRKSGITRSLSEGARAYNSATFDRLVNLRRGDPGGMHISHTWEELSDNHQLPIHKLKLRVQNQQEELVTLQWRHEQAPQDRHDCHGSTLLGVKRSPDFPESEDLGGSEMCQEDLKNYRSDEDEHSWMQSAPSFCSENEISPAHDHLGKYVKKAGGKDSAESNRPSLKEISAVIATNSQESKK